MSQAESIQFAVERLRGGGLVAFPTETVYGLGADALNPAAVNLVFETKRRPPTNPLIIHVDGEDMARRVVREWPDSARRLADRFWPGPLTLVLPKADCIPDVATAGGATVAVRVPDHPLTLALIEAFGGPLVGPSANPAGYVSPTTAGHVRAHFDEQAVLVLDGGPCKAGLESTVLDLASETVRILRRGVVDPADLEEELGREIDRAKPGEIPELQADAPLASPGLVGPHYQPKAPVELITDIAVVRRTISECEGRVVLLSPPGQQVRIQPPHLSIAMPGLARGYARKLYAALREADEANPALIVIVMPLLTDSPVWDAVRDRLRAAAE